MFYSGNSRPNKRLQRPPIEAGSWCLPGGKNDFSRPVRARVNPPTDYGHFLRTKWLLLLGHFRLAAANHLDKKALGRAAHDNSRTTVAALKKAFARSQIQAATNLLSVVACQTVLLQDRRDLLGETDLILG